MPILREAPASDVHRAAPGGRLLGDDAGDLQVVGSAIHCLVVSLVVEVRFPV
jgi:hypothetical protein